jgi:hypothetical protein
MVGALSTAHLANGNDHGGDTEIRAYIGLVQGTFTRSELVRPKILIDTSHLRVHRMHRSAA